MSAAGPRIGEDELHAFVDNRLEPGRRAIVEAWLESNPEAADRVRAWQVQRDVIRTALGGQPAPDPKFNLLALSEGRIRQIRSSRKLAIAASVLLALAAGLAAGWGLHGMSRTAPIAAMAILEQEAFATYAVYASDRRHPIEVGATDREHLAQWLSNRLNRKVAPPDLSQAGWHLLGGRLLATERGGAAALFMYDNAQGQRLSLLLRPMAPDIASPEPQRIGGPVNGSAWIEHGVGYAVVGPAPRDQISVISRLIKQQAPA